MIEVNDLSFAYKSQKIISKVCFSIEKGDFFCLIGPNGTGKSTLIKILCGFLPYQEGSIKIKGTELKLLKENLLNLVGILPDNFSVPGDFTVYELFMFCAQALGYSTLEAKKKSEQLINTFDLNAHKNKLIKNLSSGLRRRVEIAQTLINDCEVVILDEPTNALDPKSSEDIKMLIKTLNLRGKTIVYVTHLLNEIEDLYTKVGILYNSQLKLFSKDELRSHNENEVFISFSTQEDLKIGIEFLTANNIDYEVKSFGIIKTKNKDYQCDIFKLLNELNKIVNKPVTFSLGKIDVATLYNSLLIWEKGGKSN
ncbi:ABC transporter ATP-binding protein [Caldicellulosiruptor changbaiensis]|nr:ABC transporter ATP-binding protein [Caldicellulosiruptor changbaiensis]